MNVLIICPVYEPHAGGGGQYFPLLARELAASATVESVCILTERHPERPCVAVEHGTRVYRLLPQRDTRADKSTAYAIGSFLLTYLWLPVLVPALVVRERIEVLHCARYLRRPFYLLLWLLRRVLRTRAVLDVRATLDEPRVFARAFGFDHIICNSEAVLRQVAAQHPRAPYELVENPMRFPTPLPPDEAAAEVAAVSPHVRAPYLAYIGQLLERKSFFEVMDGFTGFSRRHPEYRIVLAGRNMIGEAAAARLASQPGAVYVGEVTHRQSVALMQLSAAVVQPSKREGIPRVSLEALSLGRKVLLPPCVPEFASAGPDFTINEVSAAAIEAGLERVVASHDRPRYDLARHQPANAIAKVLRIYAAILGRPAAAPVHGQVRH